MKTTLLILLSSLVYLHSFAQHIPLSQVPQAVIKSFNKYFPHSAKTEWEKKGNNYEAAFDLKRTDHKALFDPNGQLIVYKKDIPQSQLPAPVKQAVKQRYPHHKIDDAEMIARNGRVYYQLELDGKQDLKLVLNRQGQEESSQGY